MILSVKVTPNASLNKVVQVQDILKVYVTTAPEHGKANKAVLSILAKHLNVSKSSLEIIKGQNSQNKLIKVNDQER